MVTSRQLKRLVTNPAELARFQRTGRLPEGIKPRSPLITLLEAINPADRIRILGVRVDARLGYQGSREFHNAAQALHWLKPAPEVFGAFYAESWRIKAFERRLFLEDLTDCCRAAPEALSQRYPALLRPASRGPKP